MSWIDVVDTALKIGLGATIAAVASYLTVRSNQNSEARKRNEDRFYRVQDERKLAYIEFSCKSHSLIRTYTYQSCDSSEEDYSDYINTFNRVQILSEDGIRVCASDTFNSVTQYIITNKSHYEGVAGRDMIELHDAMNSKAKESIAIFQKNSSTRGS